MENEKKMKNFSLSVIGLGFFLWILLTLPIVGQSQIDKEKNNKVEFNWVDFLFFNPFIFDVNAGLDICPPFYPDWEIEYNQKIRDLSNFKLEGHEIKTIRLGSAPPPSCYEIPVEKISSSVETHTDLNPKTVIQPKWGFGFHGGATFPVIELGNRYKYSYMFVVNAEYYLYPHLSAVALIGFNKFRAKPAFSYFGNTYWWNLSANIKWEFSTSRIRPYINGGVGLYIPKNGLTRPGFNVGAGLNRLLNPNLILDFGVDFHYIILANLKDPEFYVVHAGFIYLL